MKENKAPEKKTETKLEKIIYIILKTIVYGGSIIFLIIALYFANWIYVSDSFIIPSSSMEPTLIPGDKVLVNKLIFGGRVYEEFDFRKGVEMKSYRAWGLRNLEHNDVVIFNCPQNRERTKIEFEINYVYGKRCIGLPGDSVSAVNGYFKNNNFEGVLGIKLQQDILSQTPDSLIHKSVINAMPFDKKNFGWTIKNFGPLYVPKAGDEIKLDSLNVKLYKKVIEFEEGDEVTVDDQGVIKVGDEIISKYRFKRNYYYMCGDNVSDSNDSRYWGFVPEEFIIGVVSKVLYSKDRVTGEYRWDRFSKNVL